MLEYGSDLHVNERQKIRHYRVRSTEEEEKNSKKEKCRMVTFHFSQRARKLGYYGDVIHLFYWKSAVKHDGGV